jgi:hypothetical protein
MMCIEYRISVIDRDLGYLPNLGYIGRFTANRRREISPYLLRTNAQDVGGNNSFMQDDTRDYTNYTNQGEQPTVLTDSG